jgi:CheY-like chemotaxis protein
MAAILIVEEDGVLAQQMARTLRQTGHIPILAPDAQSALRGAEARPDVILLDLELSEISGEELLARLHRQTGTARTPLVALTWKREAAAQLREKGGVADVLLKPVSGVHLREAVDRLLATQGQSPDEALHLEQRRQRDLILLLIAHAPDPLVFQISRRICADRTGERNLQHAETLSWAEIADWGKREGLLDAEQASLLRHVSGPTGSRTRQGAA